MTLKISNRDARRLWLDRQGLAETPTGEISPDVVLKIIERLGFVQLDTIRIVARAHDHILWSRNQHYREQMLDELIVARKAFEHFTHDASVLPISFYPNWRRQFDRMRRKIDGGPWGKQLPSARECAAILKRVKEEGPLSTRAFEAQARNRTEGWSRPPHKRALDYYWYAGVLATCHRKSFIKHYDVSEKVIPPAVLNEKVSDAQQLDWLCGQALDRLGFGSEGDIMRFWAAADLGEVKRWTKKRRKALIDVEIDCSDGNPYRALAPADIEDRLKHLKAPTSRLRILNPFDPVIRDRNRLQRLFGFDYRIEIFVPAAKRQYGYYIYPMLEGDRFIGRIEVRADRKQQTLNVENLWWEKGVKETDARLKKLKAELDRMARFVGVSEVVFSVAGK